jgi:hypothetical protein
LAVGGLLLIALFLLSVRAFVRVRRFASVAHFDAFACASL